MQNPENSIWGSMWGGIIQVNAEDFSPWHPFKFYLSFKILFRLFFPRFICYSISHLFASLDLNIYLPKYLFLLSPLPFILSLSPLLCLPSCLVHPRWHYYSHHHTPAATTTPPVHRRTSRPFLVACGKWGAPHSLNTKCWTLFCVFVMILWFLGLGIQVCKFWYKFTIF